MTSAQLPPLRVEDGSLRISLSPPSDGNLPHGSGDDAAPEARPPPPHDIPVHPIPSLQDAFTESLDEVTNGTAAHKPSLAALDARGRREALLGQDREAKPFDAAWRYRPGQRQHELFKLIAQISFGVYLLLNGMANNNAQVVSILQGHIDDVDEFLEVALQDLAQAAADLNARLEHLKLPMSNVQAFEQLLEDRDFRCEILEANEKIDHIISRTTAAMKQWDDDVNAGMQSTAAFTRWLNDQRHAVATTQQPDVADVFDAMKGNADGWLITFDDISDRAQDVNNLLIRLTTVVAEMENRAGEVSRRTWSKIPPFSTPSHLSYGGKPPSIESAGSSRQSGSRPPHLQQPSIRSASSSRTRPTTADDDGDARAMESPTMPEVSPLRPAPLSTRRAMSGSDDSRLSVQQAASLRSVSSPESSVASGQKEVQHQSASIDASLYLLQPRIYTPKTPDPSSSPMLQDAASITPKPERKPVVQQAGSISESVHGSPNQTSSIRQRVSRKTSVPDAIHIPPPRSIATTSAPRPSSKYATPRTTMSQPFDSAYCSDVEAQSQRQSSNAGSDASMSPTVRPQFTHSPRSDNNQYYRPVRASPHSPLQQRPHTATNPQFNLHQVHNQPARLGSTSTLSNATVAPRNERSVTPTARSQEGDRSLKKKKSAFGWFKKAFSLDEEERAAFEARRAMGQTESYYDANSPKFIDGRRVR